MPVASVSQIRVHWRYLPLFFLFTWRAIVQARRAPGHLASAIRGPTAGAFWTLTVWADLPALRAYRNARPHRDAMRNSFSWRARVHSARWDVASGELPSWSDAEQALAAAPHELRVE